MNTSPLPSTPRFKDALAKAEAYAKKCDHAYVGSEHILVALLGYGGDGPCGRIMTKFGVDLNGLLEFAKEEVVKSGIPTVPDPQKGSREEIAALLRKAAEMIEKL